MFRLLFCILTISLDDSMCCLPSSKSQHSDGYWVDSSGDRVLHGFPNALFRKSTAAVWHKPSYNYMSTFHYAGWFSIGIPPPPLKKKTLNKWVVLIAQNPKQPGFAHWNAISIGSSGKNGPFLGLSWPESLASLPPHPHEAGAGG